MNNKIMIILAGFILLVGVFGLNKSIDASKSKHQIEKETRIKIEEEIKEKLAKEEKEKAKQKALDGEKIVNAYALKNDLFTGELVGLGDIELVAKKQKDIPRGVKFTDNSNKLIGSIVIFPMKKSQLLDTNNLANKNSKEYKNLRANAKNGLSFGFELDSRDFAMLENLRPNDKVDLYFRYETKIADKKESLVGKDKQSQKNTTLSNLILLFSKKRVLFNQRFVKNNDEQQGLYNTQNQKDVQGMLFVELSQDEILKVLTIEKLGKFFIFESKNKNQAQVSTKAVLPQEFIQELRGDKNEK